MACIVLGLALVVATPFAAAQAGSVAGASAPAVEFRIGAGDVLQLFVWKEPELSRTVTVRVDGKLTVPLLGDVAAAGKSTRELTSELQALLGRYLEAPQVTLEVTQANSSRIYVLGLVANPGVYPLTQPTTVLQGLAFAGGFKEFARTEDIVIIRDGEMGPKSVPVNFKKIEAGRDLGQNVVLRAGDTIVVP
jgi:polysaccharide export outer membrane protein